MCLHKGTDYMRVGVHSGRSRSLHVRVWLRNHAVRKRALPIYELACTAEDHDLCMFEFGIGITMFANGHIPYTNWRAQRKITIFACSSFASELRCSQTGTSHRRIGVSRTFGRYSEHRSLNYVVGTTLFANGTSLYKNKHPSRGCTQQTRCVR